MALIPKTHIGSFLSCFYFTPVVFLYKNVPYSNILGNSLLFNLYLHNFNHNSLGDKHRDSNLSIHYLVLYAFSLDVWYKILWLHNPCILHVCNTSILWVTLSSTVKYIISGPQSPVTAVSQYFCSSPVETSYKTVLEKRGPMTQSSQIFSDLRWVSVFILLRLWQN